MNAAADSLVIEYLPLGSLVPYARNSRTHSEAQVAQIAASIREFGFTNPVLIDEHGGIIAGHGRVLAADSLRLVNGPCIRLSHLSEAQRRAYVIADNKLALNAGWDDALLRAELEALKGDAFDLALIGFSQDDLDVLFEPIPPADTRDPDATPEARPEAHSVPGDVWVMGPHRVVCGDCCEASVWEALMGHEMADCMWTDPPYNVAYEGRAGTIQNDSMASADFGEFLRNAYAAMFAALRPGASIYVAHSDVEGVNFRVGFQEAGFKLAGCIIWRKNHFSLGRADYQGLHEPILYGWKPGRAHRWFGGRKQTSVQDLGEASPFQQHDDTTWSIKVGDQLLLVSGEAKVSEAPGSLIECDKPVRSPLHPTMKPVALIEKMLRFSARPGDIIADAFGGSGSTLMAADRMGMVARLVELEPRFADVIVQRWQNYSGEIATHARTGAAFPLPPELGEAA